MADPFEGYSSALDSPGSVHYTLTADPNADLDPRPRGIWCQAAGTITVTDKSGTALTYTMAQGQILPFRPVRCAAISGGTFYAITG